MSFFYEYLKCYPSEDERYDIIKSEWSSKALSSGIVQASIKELAKFISNKNDTFTLAKLKDSIWFIKENFEYMQMRVSIIGVGSDTDYSDIDLIREIKNCCRETICFCILPNDKYRIWPLSSSDMKIGAASAIPLYPCDIDAIAGKKIDIFSLLEYKLFRRLVLEKDEIDTQFHPRLFDEFRKLKDFKSDKDFQYIDDAIQDLFESYNEWVNHPFSIKVSKTVENGRGCLLSGPSSSGKSVLAFQVGRILKNLGWKVFYINLSFISFSIINILEKILIKSSLNTYSTLFIIDDLQSSPGMSRYLLSIANLAQR